MNESYFGGMAVIVFCVVILLVKIRTLTKELKAEKEHRFYIEKAFGLLSCVISCVRCKDIEQLREVVAKGCELKKQPKRVILEVHEAYNRAFDAFLELERGYSKKWMWLNIGDVLQSGDERKINDGSWSRVPYDRVGQAITSSLDDSGNHILYRREAPEAPSPAPQSARVGSVREVRLPKDHPLNLSRRATTDGATAQVFQANPTPPTNENPTSTPASA